jgi:hypothetical protein
MSLHLAFVWIISILAATLIITFVLELSTHDGLLGQSIWEHYKLNLWQILIAFGWITGIATIIGLMRTFYDGARMNYHFVIEFYERLLEFYYQRLPQMKLVYTKKPSDMIEANQREDVLHLEFPAEPQQQPMQLLPQQPMQQQQQPMQQQQQQQPPVLHIEEPELPPRRQQPYRTRRRSIY